MSYRDPPFSFVILARPPDDDDDEPPILAVEDTEPAAHRMARVLGGAVIEKHRRTDVLTDGVRTYEYVESLTPRHLQQENRHG